MFFSHEILISKKKGSLAIIWLAANLGSKSQAKKLTKKDYISVNVSETCAVLMNPNEPMALRLTSNLMMGLTKVYWQQYQIYYDEVQAFLNRLYLAKDIKISKVNMVQPNVRADLITLELGNEANMPFDHLRLKDTFFFDQTKFPQIPLTPEIARNIPENERWLHNSTPKLSHQNININMPRQYSLTGLMSTSSYSNLASRQESFSSLTIGGNALADYNFGEPFGENPELDPMGQLIKETLLELEKGDQHIVPQHEIEILEDNKEKLVQSEESETSVPQQTARKKRKHNSAKSTLPFDNITEIPAIEISQMLKDRTAVIKTMHQMFFEHVNIRKQENFMDLLATGFLPHTNEQFAQICKGGLISSSSRSSPSSGSSKSELQKREISSKISAFQHENYIHSNGDNNSIHWDSTLTPINHYISRQFPWSSSSPIGNDILRVPSISSPLEKKAKRPFKDRELKLENEEKNEQNLIQKVSKQPIFIERGIQQFNRYLNNELRNQKNDMLRFNELFTRQTKKFVIAQGFHYVLELATAADIIVRQTKPFGDIEISLN